MKIRAAIIYILSLLSPELSVAENPVVSTYATLSQKIAVATKTGITDTAAATKTFLSIIAEAKNNGLDYIAGRAYFQMAQMFFLHKNHHRSFGAFFNAREHFKKSNSRKELAETLCGMGRQQYFRGNYKVAIEHLNFAVKDARALNLKSLEADALEWLGLLFHVLPGMSKDATAQLKQALALKQKINDREGAVRLMQKLGEIYGENRRYDSALAFFNQAIPAAISLGMLRDAYLATLDRSSAYTNTGRPGLAAKDIEYIRTNADTSDFNIKIRWLVQLGNLHMLSDSAKGRQYFENALAAAEEICSPEIYGLIYRTMGDAYARQGMYKEAHQFSQRYNKYLSVYYGQNSGTFKELEYILNSSAAREQLAFANLQNSLIETRLQQARRNKIYLTGGLLMLISLSTLIYFLYRKQKLKNKIIKKQADDLRNLMKEIHHRLKNNFQIISSLLDLQSKTVKDHQASQALTEARNRVHSMAIIHQNLYGSSQVESIAVAPYIQSLVANLFNSYNILPGKVSLVTDLEDMSLDIDTVIPIGLILNELISNSLKHAFAAAEKGIITVILKRDNNEILLQVSDNGAGFATGPSAASSFGMRMVKIFAQKLKAELEIFNNNGACVRMRITKFRITRHTTAAGDFSTRCARSK